MPLVITREPYPDESGIGYYRRLSADNALFGWRNLAGTAGVEPKRQALLLRPQEVASNLGLNPMWTQAANDKEERCRHWARLYRSHVDAVCPACLAEAPYQRHAWEHAYATACTKHRIQLVDTCNACGKHLSPTRPYIGLCECDQELASLPQTPATPAQLWLSGLLANDGRSGEQKPHFKDVDTDTLVKVVRTLCRHPDPAKPPLPRGSDLPKTVAKAIAFLAPLEGLLANWPLGLRAHVEKRIAAGRKDARTLNTLLGEWYISLRKTCQGTAFEPLLQTVIDVAADKSDCVLGMDSAKAMAEDTIRYVRSPDAAKAIGVSISRMLDALQREECEYRTKRMGTRGQLYEVPNAEVERIQKERSGWLTDQATCELAAVTPAVLERMKAAGVVESDIRWREDILKGGPVNRKSLVELYDRVCKCAEPDAVEEETEEAVEEEKEQAMLTWAQFTSRRMGDKRAIEALMQAIASGELKATQRAKTLGDMAFRLSEVKRYFGTPVLEAGMSIQQLAKATGWKWESIANWMDEGLLGCETIELRGQPCRVVLPQQLLAFRQSYIPLADLARAMGKKASALAQLLTGVELVGAKTLPNGSQRGALLRMADLGRLAVIGAKAGWDLFVPVG